jgi:hypothetical protein
MPAKAMPRIFGKVSREEVEQSCPRRTRQRGAFYARAATRRAKVLRFSRFAPQQWLARFQCAAVLRVYGQRGTRMRKPRAWRGRCKKASVQAGSAFALDVIGTLQNPDPVQSQRVNWSYENRRLVHHWCAHRHHPAIIRARGSQQPRAAKVLPHFLRGRAWATPEFHPPLPWVDMTLDEIRLLHFKDAPAKTAAK